MPLNPRQIKRGRFKLFFLVSDCGLRKAEFVPAAKVFPGKGMVRKITNGMIVIAMTIALQATQTTVVQAVQASNDPVGEVRAAIAEASPIFANDKLSPQEREQQLRAVAVKYLDFTYMARSAMGVHWKSLTPAQRKEFVPLLSDYVMDTYLGNLKDTTVEAASHALGDKVNYDAPDLASVPSIVHLPAVADPLKVQYMLRKDPNGWRLYDIVVDGVSTMASYRDQFNTTMNNDGFR
jgi:phospholipid transport system substrate-binding protein